MEFDNQTVQPVGEAEQVVQPTADTTDVSLNDTGSGTDTGDSIPDIYFDEDGNAVFSDDFMKVLGGGSDEPILEAEEEVEPEPKENEGSYTAEQLGEVGIEKLDPKRIPPELVPFYKSMLADYTRKTSAVAAERKSLEEQLVTRQSQPVVPEQAVPPQAQAPEGASYYEQLYNIAIKNLEDPSKLGTQFDEMNPLHVTALASEVSRIQETLSRQKQQEAQMGSVLAKYTSDPSWSDIYAYANDVLENLPHRESARIQARLASGDIAFIDKFLNTAKDTYYESKGIVHNLQSPVAPAKPAQVVAPPVLESSGAGVSGVGVQELDYSKLGKMSYEEQANFLVNSGFVK